MTIHISEYNAVVNGLGQQLKLLRREGDDLRAELKEARELYAATAQLLMESSKQVSELNYENAALKKMAEPITEKRTEPTTDL